MFLRKILMFPDSEVGDSAANADVVDVATSEEPATPTEPATEPEKPEENPQEPPKETDITETQKFAKRLAEKTAETEKAIASKYNETIAKLGMEWDGKPITTIEELQHAYEQQELRKQAQEKNIPVDVLEDLQKTKATAEQALSRLSQYERKEALSKEAETLKADPKWGGFYTEHEQEIKAVADQFNVDLGTAKLIVYDKMGPQTVDVEALKQQAIQEYLNKKINLNQPVEGGGASPVSVQERPKTFAEARKNALAQIRAAREMKG